MSFLLLIWLSSLPLGISWPRPLGHAAIGTMLHLEYTRAAKLEIASPTKIRISGSVPDFSLDANDTTSVRWLQWCRTLDRFYSNEGTPRGDHPVFRIREAYTLPKDFSQLQQALRDEAYSLASELLQKIDKKQHKAIKDWRLKLAAGPNVWTSTVARWIKKPPLALPYSIKIDQGDCVSSTVGLTEMHDATYSFYQGLYNAGDQFILPDPKLIGADILPDAFRLESFTQVVAQVIAKSSPRKATGLDGLSVADFKALPLPAINSIARLFHDILTQATFPEPWLNIKVTLIPKKGGDIALKDLRPLSTAPVAYRIWAKSLLILCSHAGANIHPCSVGGIGLAIDTQKFFDVIPHALAARCLTEIGVPPVVVFAWLKYITSIRRYISIHNSIADKPLTADRGIPQGDPISMLAAAAALGLWLNDLNRIPSSPSDEAWVFVDDRLLFQEVTEQGCTLQDKFDLTCRWDASWAFNTRPKTVCLRFGRMLLDVYWPDGQPVAVEEHPTYLGVPVLLPSFSRAAFYQPIVEECCYILRNLITAKSLLTITQRRYAVAAVVMKKLCYSSVIARLTTKQVSKVRSLVMQVIFDKPLACHDAAVALVLQGHMLDYSFAAVYTSISNWHRYLRDAGPQVLLCHIDHYSTKPGKGPIRNLLDDLCLLDWHFDRDTCTFQDNQNSLVWDPTNTSIKHLQHKLREAYRQSLLTGLEGSSSSWVGMIHASPAHTSALHKKWAEHPNRFILERFLTNAHCTPYRLFLTQKRESPQCPYCKHDCADTPHLLFDCPHFAHLREGAPTAIVSQQHWPQCSRACLIFSYHLPIEAQQTWLDIQAWACRLFALWYHAERQINASEKKGLPPNDASVLDFSPPCAVGQLEPNPVDATARRLISTAPSQKLAIKWAPFTSRTQWSEWKASPTAFAQLFLFWSIWRPATNAALECRYCTWHEALLLYLQFTGSLAFKFGNVTFSQAVYLFKRLSAKLLIQCQAIDDFVEGELVRWSPDLPLDATITFAHPTLHLEDDMIENLLVLQEEFVQNNNATRAYIHAQYDDLVPPEPTCIPSFSCFLFLRRLRSKTTAMSWWKYKYEIFSLLQPSTVRAAVKPGAGLTQFPVDLLDQIPLDDFHSALGGCYASNLQGMLRRWKLAAASCQNTLENHYVILPLWETEQWSCLGCQRPANLTRDPAWGTKSCSRPWTHPVDMQPILNAINFLELLLNKLRFRSFRGHLLPDFTPDPLQLILQLEQHATLLTLGTFAQWVDLPENHPRLPTKKKELLLRWALIQKSWDSAAQTFIPYSVTAFEGYCTSCLAAPKNFQSFLRTPCGSHRMDSVNNAIRLRMLQVHKNIANASLTAGDAGSSDLAHFFHVSIHFHFDCSTCPLFDAKLSSSCHGSSCNLILPSHSFTESHIASIDLAPNASLDILGCVPEALYIFAAGFVFFCTVYRLRAGRVFPLLSPSYYYVRTIFLF